MVCISNKKYTIMNKKSWYYFFTSNEFRNNIKWNDDKDSYYENKKWKLLLSIIYLETINILFIFINQIKLMNLKTHKWKL